MSAILQAQLSAEFPRPSGTNVPYPHPNLAMSTPGGVQDILVIFVGFFLTFALTIRMSLACRLLFFIHELWGNCDSDSGGTGASPFG